MLVLPIKRKWYDMILSGEKKEEYRAYTPYWIRRFCNLGLLEHIRGDAYKAHRYTHKLVTFRNGYSATSRSFIAEIRLSIGYGEPRWGAKEGERYLVLTIVKIMNGGAGGYGEKQKPGVRIGHQEPRKHSEEVRGSWL